MTRWPSPREVLSITPRVIAGTLGAFAAGALATTVLSLILARLGLTPADAVTVALMAGPVIIALLCLVAFHSRSPARTLGWLTAAWAPLALIYALLRSSSS